MRGSPGAQPSLRRRSPALVRRPALANFWLDDRLPLRGPDSITLCVINAARYTRQVLRSFADKDTERVWRRERSRRLDPTTQRAALRKLLILDAAETLDDVKIPPGNRLEKLRGDRAGQHSIRVNQQWRICFRWTPAGPGDVQIVDYH